MSAILVLLALLSVATLASRRGYAAFVVHIVTTPLLLIAGFVVAPDQLALLRPSTTDALMPAMRVGAAWLVLILGMRGMQPRFSRNYLSLAATSFLLATSTWALLSAVAFGVLEAFDRFGIDFGTDSHLSRAGAALLIGGLLSSTGLAFARESLQGIIRKKAHHQLLFLARHDDFLSALALCVAVWLWPVAPDSAPIYEFPVLAASLLIGFGILLALSHLINIGLKAKANQSSIIALIGLTVFIAGVSISTRLPEAPTAFFLGAALGIVGVGARTLHHGSLAATERPVRIALLFLVGVHLSFTTGPVVLGIVLALARFGLKYIVRAILVGKAKEVPLSGLVGASGTTLAFALSFALSRPGELTGNEVLVTTAVAVSVSDMLALISWRRKPSQSAAPVEAI